MNNLKLGDVVVLKSGGPLMTVSALNSNDMATCTWFNDGKRVERDNFRSDSLKLQPV